MLPNGIIPEIILFNNDLIQELDNGYEFVDPAFELWFNNQYFNISYLINRAG
jgi:hypothetical protein